MSYRDFFYMVIGLGFLILAKGKNSVIGYSSPKPFKISDTEECAAYNIQVVDNWLYHLRNYTNNCNPLNEKQVLELGPGSDLGIGLYLLSLGCKNYSAIDVNNLMKNTPEKFYDDFLLKIKRSNKKVDIDFLKGQIINMKHGKTSLLSYCVCKDFNLVNAIKPSTIDLVFSQAAFEHFDKIEETIQQLNIVCKPGAILISEIDLKTHSRWIREKDPNNIYRYPKWLYNLFTFQGVPSRMRPYRYKIFFLKNGWKNVTITPLKQIINRALCSGMNKEFHGKINQMDLLSVVLCARKT